MSGLPVLSVSECLQSLNDILKTQVVCVEGEVQGFAISQNRWCFFTLKDAKDGSVLECFMMAFRLRQTLENGMIVRVTAVPAIHAKSGRFRLMVEQVAVVGEGGLRKAYELLHARLEKEGLFSPARKRALPRFPTKVGLLASTTSAAYSDFLKILKERYANLEVVVANAQVQGEGAVASVRGALAMLLEEEELSAIVMTRGGGSLEDLMAFNDESLARDIFRSSVPIIVAIGHERDFTIAEEVADVRASTPSNAAELLVPHRREVLAELVARRNAMTSSIQKQLMLRHHDVERWGAQFIGYFERQRVVALERSRAFLSAAGRFTDTVLQVRDLWSKQALSVLRAIEAKVQHGAVQARDAERLIMSFHPNRVLRRGYSIVRRRGQVIQSVNEARPGETIELTLIDGTIDAAVSSTHPTGV